MACELCLHSARAVRYYSWRTRVLIFILGSCLPRARAFVPCFSALFGRRYGHDKNALRVCVHTAPVSGVVTACGCCVLLLLCNPFLFVQITKCLHACKKCPVDNALLVVSRRWLSIMFVSLSLLVMLLCR